MIKKLMIPCLVSGVEMFAFSCSRDPLIASRHYYTSCYRVSLSYLKGTVLGHSVQQISPVGGMTRPCRDNLMTLSDACEDNNNNEKNRRLGTDWKGRKLSGNTLIIHWMCLWMMWLIWKTWLEGLQIWYFGCKKKNFTLVSLSVCLSNSPFV